MNKVLLIIVVLIGIIFNFLDIKSIGILMLFIVLVLVHIPTNYFYLVNKPLYLFQAYLTILSSLVYTLDKENLTTPILQIVIFIFLLSLMILLVFYLTSKKRDDKHRYLKLLKQSYINFNFCIVFVLLDYWH